MNIFTIIISRQLPWIQIAFSVKTHLVNKSFRFSLTELLVVIAIIAILMSLLSPSLRSAIRAAEKAQCRVNLKSLAAVSYLYADDYNDFLMLGSGTDRGNMGHYAAWGIAMYDLNWERYVCPGRDEPVFPEILWPQKAGWQSLFWQSRKDANAEPGDNTYGRGRFSDEDIAGRSFWRMFVNIPGNKKHAEPYFGSVYKASDEEFIRNHLEDNRNGLNQPEFLNRIIDLMDRGGKEYLFREDGMYSVDDGKYASRELLTSYHAFGLSLDDYQGYTGRILSAQDPTFAHFSDIVIPGIPQNNDQVPYFSNLNMPNAVVVSGHVDSSGFPEGGHVALFDGSVEWRDCTFLGWNGKAESEKEADFDGWMRYAKGRNDSGSFAWPVGSFFLRSSGSGHHGSGIGRDKLLIRDPDGIDYNYGEH